MSAPDNRSHYAERLLPNFERFINELAKLPSGVPSTLRRMPALQPEDMPSTFESAFNTGDIEQVMALYEPNAVLIPQPGQVVQGVAAAREALRGFLAFKLPIHLEVKRVLSAGDVALLSTTWSLAGTGPDGASVNLSGTTTEVIRRQSDGTWRYVIDDPFSIV